MKVISDNKGTWPVYVRRPAGNVTILLNVQNCRNPLATLRRILPPRTGLQILPERCTCSRNWISVPTNCRYRQYHRISI
jgi:hypothetical protein